MSQWVQWQEESRLPVYSQQQLLSPVSIIGTNISWVSICHRDRGGGGGELSDDSQISPAPPPLPPLILLAGARGPVTRFARQNKYLRWRHLYFSHLNCRPRRLCHTMLILAAIQQSDNHSPGTMLAGAGVTWPHISNFVWVCGLSLYRNCAQDFEGRLDICLCLSNWYKYHCTIAFRGMRF